MLSQTDFILLLCYFTNLIELLRINKTKTSPFTSGFISLYERAKLKITIYIYRILHFLYIILYHVTPDSHVVRLLLVLLCTTSSSTILLTSLVGWVYNGWMVSRLVD